MYVSVNPHWNGKLWRVDIQKNGTRKTFSSSVPRSEGKRIVREKALAWLEDPEQNKFCTFSELFPRFLTFYAEKNGKNVSFSRYVSVGKNHLMPVLEKKVVSRITLDQWQSCISQAEPKNGRTDVLSRKSLGAIRETIAAFMKWAKPRHYMDEDFSSELYIPKAAPKKGREILQVEDIKNWFGNPTGLWYEKGLWLQLLIGARPGEILGLKISDFDPKTHILTISRAINAQGQITPGKNKNAHRQVLLTDKALEIFLEQSEVSRQLRSDWLFCGKFGQKPSPRKYYQTMTVICERLQMPKISPYCLRHTFFTLVEEYLPSRSMKAIFGHSEATDSHNLYGDHMIDGELGRISEQLKVTPLYMAAN